MKAEEVNYLQLRRAAAGGVAVVPMGSLEAHGPHLPCGTDCVLVEAILERALAGSDPARVVVFPVVRYSVVTWAAPLGSAGVSPQALLRSLVEVFGDIHALGFRRIVAVHGHEGHQVANVAFWQLWHEGVRGLFADVHPYVIAAARAAALCPEGLTHAGLAETAMMLAACPERVTLPAPDGPGDLWGARFPYPSLRRPGVYCIPTIETLPDGVEGRAAAATPELGEALLDLYAGAVAEILNDLLAGDVPGEFLRRFRKPVDNGQ